jgi:sugar lactone lactonase YvrE
VASGGAMTTVAQISADQSNCFVNDGKCDALGNLWAGSIQLAGDGDPVPGGSAPHRLDGHGEIATVVRDLTASNGLDLSPDGRTFYLIDCCSPGVTGLPTNIFRTGGGLGTRATPAD